MKDRPSSSPDGPGELDQLSHGELVQLVRWLQTQVAERDRAIAALRTRLGAGNDRSSRAEAGTPSPAAEPAMRRRIELVPGVDYTLVFDGGSLGNPGRGYGSFQLVGRDGSVIEDRLEYGDNVTNNQAEYLTLIRALEILAARLGAEAAQTTLAIRGDSKLIIEQVSGRWKVKQETLQPLRQRVVELLRAFGRVDIAWHPRRASVRVLGH